MFDKGSSKIEGFTLRLTLYGKQSQQGYKERIDKIVWSPDGKRIASGGDRILIHDLSRRTVTPIFGERFLSILAWSPDGNSLAIGHRDDNVSVWNLENDQDTPIFKDVGPEVSCIAWSSDGQILASGFNDGSIRIWSINGYIDQEVGHVFGESITNIAWSPNGRMLASSSSSGSVYFWNAMTGKLIRSVKSHSSEIYEIAWSLDGNLLVSCSKDQTIRIINIETGRQGIILEGHTGAVTSIKFSSKGHLLASRSMDNTVRIWHCDSWQTVAILREQSPDIYSNLAFHPTTSVLATVGDKNTAIHIWTFELPLLLDIASKTSAAKYTNAKVVLVGDSGVGKSGLGLTLSGQPFAPTESTHGRRIWTFLSEKVTLDNGGEETREILLWDLAGQPGYRLIHQLHLNEVALALVVFDAHSETDPFAGVRHWDRALRQAQRVQGETEFPIKKLLILARIDRGGISVSRERIRMLVQDLEFDDYIETSAREGWNIKDLATKIEELINWSLLPKVISTNLFQQIKAFLIEEKESARYLSTMEDLFHSFVRSNRLLPQDSDVRAQFETCIGRVESRGLIRRLNFGGLILLQPELLDSYASSIVNAARDEPDGLGSIDENMARDGRFRMSSDERIKDKMQEKLLLIATIEDLLGHEIALREPADDGSYLVFPSQLTRERPGIPDPEGQAVIITFEGPVLSIYATLIVRISHSGVFTKRELWRNAATYDAKTGGVCGVVLRELEEGRGELLLHFKDFASDETCFQFEEYIISHLLRRSLKNSVFRYRRFVCEGCGFVVTDQLIQLRTERGFNWVTCPGCGDRISLIDRKEHISSLRLSRVTDMDRAADAQRNLETAESVFQGKVMVGDSDLQTMELVVIKRRRLYILEQQRAYHGYTTPPEVIMEIDDLQSNIEKLEQQLWHK
jgi:small GTP-binding protein